MIDREHQRLSVSRQCQLLAVSRSTVYYRPLGESAQTLALMRRIDELYLEYPFYGSRQMMRHLARERVKVGRHRVRRLMRLLGLEAIYRKPRTSVANPEHRVYPLKYEAVYLRELQDGFEARSGGGEAETAASCEHSGQVAEQYEAGTYPHIHRLGHPPPPDPRPPLPSPV